MSLTIYVFYVYDDFVLLLFLILYFLHLLSLYESDLLDDDYGNDGSDSRSSDTCYFPLRFDKYVGCVSGLGSGVFVPAGVDFKGDVYAFVMFVPTGVESKGDRLIEIFWRSSL